MNDTTETQEVGPPPPPPPPASEGISACACGCGLAIETLDARGRARRYAHGHNGSRTTHGASRKDAMTPEYRVWQGMKSRCLCPGDASYADYGKRGIKVCDRWAQSFEAFLEDVGKRPSSGHSIERKDPNGNYEPGNVVWATRSVQARNKRNTKLITHDGLTLSLADWADRTRIPYNTLKRRFLMGWEPRRALTEPLRGAA